NADGEIWAWAKIFDSMAHDSIVEFGHRLIVALLKHGHDIRRLQLEIAQRYRLGSIEPVGGSPKSYGAAHSVKFRQHLCEPVVKGGFGMRARRRRDSGNWRNRWIGPRGQVQSHAVRQADAVQRRANNVRLRREIPAGIRIVSG